MQSEISVEQWESLEDNMDEAQKYLEELKDKGEAARKARRLLMNKIRGQLQAIKETLVKMVRNDISLKEKLEILFREEGITITSIITAVELMILTIVLAVTGGGGTAGAAAGVAAGGSKGFVQKLLQRLQKFLKFFAGNVGAALPGTAVSCEGCKVRRSAYLLGYCCCCYSICCGIRREDKRS